MSEENRIVVTEEVAMPKLQKKLPDLKTIREEHGLTIEDISRKTRISITILNAIENGEFHLLPAPVYAKKFIQIYAESIGIDPGIILDHYQRHVDIIQIEPEETEAVNKQIAFDRKPLRRYLMYTALAVAIIATALILYAFLRDNAPTGTSQHNATPNEQMKVVPKPAPAVKEQPPETVVTAPQAPQSAVTVPKESAQTLNNSGLDLLVEATEDTWLSITEDRNPPYQTTLKAGDKLSRKAREFFVIDVGNAAGVNISFLGKPLGALGRKGQVVHLRLPRQ